MAAIQNRYEFVILFDVENGNPNGDPDAGNMPRVDPETGFGLVTDVCLKRKIRNYVEMLKEDSEGYRIYIKDSIPLNRNEMEAGDACGVGDEMRSLENASNDQAKKIGAKMKKDHPDIDITIRNWLCQQFFDIRTFGAVMTTCVKGSLNCGQVRGPVQLCFAHSVDPIMPQEITINRITQTKQKDIDDNGPHTFGNKYIVPYGLYRCEGYVSANLARKTTGFSEDDLELLWQAIINMFENDRSAARGKMAVRELIVFRHDSELGNAPAYKLFELVRAEKKADVTVPRSYADYTVSVDTEKLPGGVTCIRMI